MGLLTTKSWQWGGRGLRKASIAGPRECSWHEVLRHTETDTHSHTQTHRTNDAWSRPGAEATLFSAVWRHQTEALRTEAELLTSRCQFSPFTFTVERGAAPSSAVNSRTRKRWSNFLREWAGRCNLLQVGTTDALLTKPPHLSPSSVLIAGALDAAAVSKARQWTHFCSLDPPPRQVAQTGTSFTVKTTLTWTIYCRSQLELQSPSIERYQSWGSSTPGQKMITWSRERS